MSSDKCLGCGRDTSGLEDRFAAYNCEGESVEIFALSGYFCDWRCLPPLLSSQQNRSGGEIQ